MDFYHLRVRKKAHSSFAKDRLYLWFDLNKEKLFELATLLISGDFTRVEGEKVFLSKSDDFQITKTKKKKYNFKVPNGHSLEHKYDHPVFKEQDVTNQVEGLIRKSIREKSTPINNTTPSAAIATNKVFLVHGHDEDFRDKVELLLRKQKLEPVILHEKPEKGRTIIEKFMEESEDCGFAIILFTPDDFKDGKFHARQNVLFELGYFYANLGRSRTIIILDNQEKDIEIPSDLQGIIYHSTKDNWKKTLADELAAAEYKIDFQKL